jgi:hypothetical protein
MMFLAYERGAPLCVPIVKATFSIGTGGVVALAEEQRPVSAAGTFRGEPGSSSCIYEPETAFVKLATDVALIGHAHPPSSAVDDWMVGIRVGSVQKLARVVGDRFMVRRGGATAITSPGPVERIPLVYERAFGGWDRRHADPDRHIVDLRNPVGTGLRDAGITGDDEVQLPNFEDPQEPFRTYGQRPTPVGFGFQLPHWAARGRHAGTYDAAWASTRSPLLPDDFDRRFFNAAAPGLVAPGFLSGDESVIVLNASPEGRLAFDLPGIPPPICEYRLRAGVSGTRETNLDTVIVDTDLRTLTLIWRTNFEVKRGPHDLAALRVG